MVGVKKVAVLRTDTPLQQFFSSPFPPARWGIRKHRFAFLFKDAGVGGGAICIQTEMREEIIQTISDTSGM